MHLQSKTRAFNKSDFPSSRREGGWRESRGPAGREGGEALGLAQAWEGPLPRPESVAGQRFPPFTFSFPDQAAKGLRIVPRPGSDPGRFSPQPCGRHRRCLGVEALLARAAAGWGPSSYFPEGAWPLHLGGGPP